MTELVLAGLNCTERTTDCPGFKVAGKVPPVTVKPDPVIESELMVTATVPLEVKVTDFETEVPVETFPKASDVVLRLSAGVAAFNCSATVFEDAFAVALRVAVCVVLTEATLAVKDVEEAPAAMLTLAGTVTALVLLARATLWPVEGAAELKVTVQEVVPAPVNVLLLQANPLIEGAMGEADPLSLIEVVLDVDPCVAVSVTV